MPRSNYSTKYKPDKLRRLIADGKTAREILKELRISRHTLKEHLFLLQRDDKTYYEIPGLMEDEAEFRRIIKRRRGVVHPHGALGHSDFKPGEAFELIEEDGRIILRKLS
jgi:hypothetical protein